MINQAITIFLLMIINSLILKLKTLKRPLKLHQLHMKIKPLKLSNTIIYPSHPFLFFTQILILHLYIWPQRHLMTFHHLPFDLIIQDSHPWQPKQTSKTPFTETTLNSDTYHIHRTSELLKTDPLPITLIGISHLLLLLTLLNIPIKF